MAALLFYSIVLTCGVVFLLTVAHDELSGVTEHLIDLLS
jgi:hypothetical protein